MKKLMNMLASRKIARWKLRAMPSYAEHGHLQRFNRLRIEEEVCGVDFPDAVEIRGRRRAEKNPHPRKILPSTVSNKLRGTHGDI